MAGRLAPAPADVMTLQRAVGNQVLQQILQPTGPMIQRTIDQDARTWAMDWTATWTRPFCVKVKQLHLPKLYSLLTAILGDEVPAVPAPPAPTRVEKAKQTTALAAALVRLGEKKAGQLSQRLVDSKPGADALIGELEGFVPDTIPDLHLESPASQINFDEVEREMPNPFMVLKCGGAQFTFSQEMGLHMLKRHHPEFLKGQPLMVQSFFDVGTTLKQIEALIEGTVQASMAEIKGWRESRRKMKASQLGTEAAKTLNLRPHYDGRYWELTLTLDSDNPQESKGKVAHFTPTL